MKFAELTPTQRAIALAVKRRDRERRDRDALALFAALGWLVAFYLMPR